MRSVGSELLSLATVLAIPLGIVAIFPFDAFSFTAAKRVRSPVRTAFVRMTPEAERLAMRSVRTTWREKIGEARRLKADLFLAELPEDARMSVLSLRDRSRPPDPPMARRETTPFLPSLRAPPPLPIAAGAEAEPLAFPREELLKLN